MTVVRVKKTDNFVTLYKACLQDTNISLKAKGFWAYCMGQPDDWTFHVNQLASVLKEGEDAIYSAIKELIEHGYCKRIQNNINGKFQTVDYEISEIPEEFKKRLPHRAFPDAGLPDTVNPELLSIDPLISNEKKATKERGLKPPKEKSAPPPPPDCFYEGRFENKIKITREQREKLVEKWNLESLVDAFAEKLYKYALIKPSNFKKYKRHDLVLDQWLEKELQKRAEKPRSSSGLNDLQQQNWMLNQELVSQLKIECPNSCGGLNWYYKEHVLKDSNNRNWSISGIVEHSTFRAYLEKSFNLQSLE